MVVGSGTPCTSQVPTTEPGLWEKPDMMLPEEPAVGRAALLTPKAAMSMVHVPVNAGLVVEKVSMFPEPGEPLSTYNSASKADPPVVDWLSSHTSL